MKTKKSENSEDSEPPNELLQPEILSKDALVSIFKQRKIEIPDLENLEHGALVDLFYKNIIPLPQRKYRHNRRGQTATKQQIIATKRKRSYDEINWASESVNQTSQKNQSESSRFLCSYNIPSTGDRLKPPPSAINPERKIIKLKSSSSTSVKASDKLQVINKPQVISKPQGTGTDIKDLISSTIYPKKTDNGETLTKILPSKETPNKTRTKIKLNRNSISLPSPEVSPSVVESTAKLNVVESTAKLNIIDTKKPTEEGDASEEVNSNGKQGHDESADEAGARKKFKAVSVKWP